MQDYQYQILIEKLDRLENKLSKRILKEWLNLSDLIEMTGYSKATIHRAIKCGELKSVKNRHKRMFRKEWIEQWLNG